MPWLNQILTDVEIGIEMKKIFFKFKKIKIQVEILKNFYKGIVTCM